MKRLLVDFYISNPGHHAAMMRPVVARLVEQGYRCRLLSLCEFRGLESPTAMFDMPGVAFVRLVPFHFRSSSSGGQQTGEEHRRQVRSILRWVSWQGLLKRALQRHFGEERPDLVVLPNDAAFPYDRIVEMLKTAEIPFLLLQEGIRFPLPGSEGEAYGLGGAAAIAAWGEGSAAYFRGLGVAAEAIHLTGSPRFDGILDTDWKALAASLRDELNLGDKHLLFLSNPIDDQGFCTTQEKMELVSRFIGEIAPLFDDSGFRLLMKLHGRENTADFQAVANTFSYRERIYVLRNVPLYPLFVLSQAAVVLASTVGLEALLMDIPLGVLEIPGTGFVYDYVSQRAAAGLSWTKPMNEQVWSLLANGHYDKQAVRDYIHYSLTNYDEAANNVSQLVVNFLEGGNYERH